jgi:hypothetical protein
MFASPSVILIFLLVFLNFTAFRFLLFLLMLAFDLSSLILGSGGNCSRSFRMQKLATKLKRIQLAPFAMNFLYRYFGYPSSRFCWTKGITAFFQLASLD